MLQCNNVTELQCYNVTMLQCYSVTELRVTELQCNSVRMSTVLHEMKANLEVPSSNSGGLSSEYSLLVDCSEG